jgi:hypothetical protein
MALADRAAPRARAERLAGLLAAPAIGVAQFDEEEALGHLILRALEALARARAEGRPAVALARRKAGRCAALAGTAVRRSEDGRAAAGSASRAGSPRAGPAG